MRSRRIILVALTAAVLLSGCRVRSGRRERCPGGVCPPARSQVSLAAVPRSMRERNWTDNSGRGSCGWASLMVALRHGGRSDLAARVQTARGGPATISGLMSTATKLGVRYMATRDGDERLLEWCDRSRRVAVIWYGHRHAQNFIGYDRGQAVLIDPNNPAAETRIPRAKFLRDWRKRYGGIAMVPLITRLMPARPVQPRPQQRVPQ